MNILDFPSVWLEAQSGIEATFVKQQFSALRDENARLRMEIGQLKLCLPPGITSEEWEIIKELRSMEWPNASH